MNFKRSAYDVVVVGAGPAGSVAARLAADQGMDVLLIEKRQEIGAPVRCAEAIGAEITRPYIEPDEHWINAHIASYAIYNSAGDFVMVPPTEPTLVVDRKVFDLRLAQRAVQAGAEVHTSAAAVGLLRGNGAVTGVQIHNLGHTYEIHARLVVAADGVESQVARWAGLKTVPPLEDYYVGIQFLLAGIGGQFDPRVCEYHVGRSLAPGGYAWVFPKGDNTANVGLVVSANRAADTSAQTYLERFIQKRFRDSSVLSVVLGGIPATGALKRMVTDGLVTVGDAAHQADPLTAGGINLGMIAADLAMQVAVPAIRLGDVSAKRLQSYERLWEERFGRMHRALYSVRKLLTNMEEEHFNALIPTAARLPLLEMSLSEIIVAVLKNHPRLLLEARTLITTGLIIK